MISVISETAPGIPKTVNFYLDEMDAMIVYAPNGLLAEVAQEIGDDQITSYIGKDEVVLSCDSKLAEKLLSGSANNSVEETMQKSLVRYFGN